MSAQYAASPDTLWASITDASAFPTWRPGVTSVDAVPDENGQRGWREHAGGDVVTYRVVESTPPRHLVVRIADDAPTFLAAAEELMRAGADPDWLARVDALLAQNTWDRTWARMSELIEGVAARHLAAHAGAGARTTLAKASKAGSFAAAGD